MTIKAIARTLFALMFASLLIAGIFLRIYILNDASGFYTDEGALLLNIQERNFFQLFLPLNYAQCCPPLFLVAAKILYSANSSIVELNLRALPSISSILSIILFGWICLKVCKNYLGKIFAISLFAFNPFLLQYSQEFKQYSSDVLFCLVIIAVCIWLKDKILNKRQMFALGILFSIFVWASYTTVFTVGAGILAYLLTRTEASIKVKIKNGLYFIIPYIINLIFVYKYNAIGAINNQVIQHFWTNYECFLPVTYHHISEFFKFVYFDNLIVIRACQILSVIAAIYLCRRERYLSILLLGTIILAVISGGFKLYPLAPNRVSLFIIPIFILLSAKTFDLCTYDKLKKNIGSIILITVWIWTFLVINPIQVIQYYIKTPMVFKHTTAKEYVDILYKRNIAPKDIVYVDMGSKYVFDIYVTDKNMKLKNIVNETRWEDLYLTFEEFPINSYIHIYNSRYNNNPFAYHIIQQEIKTNCKIIDKETVQSGTYIKCLKISNKRVE